MTLVKGPKKLTATGRAWNDVPTVGLFKAPASVETGNARLGKTGYLETTLKQ